VQTASLKIINKKVGIHMTEKGKNLEIGILGPKPGKTWKEKCLPEKTGTVFFTISCEASSFPYIHPQIHSKILISRLFLKPGKKFFLTWKEGTKT